MSAPAPQPPQAPLAQRETAEGVFIAVLPFDNYSPDPADAYFASGMTEEITSQLSRVSALHVISRTAVSRALESRLSLAELAATLGVGAVLEGSVRKSGDMVRITTQLVDAMSGQHLWSTDFDRELADVFAIQREVALAIAAALQAELSPGEQARIDTPPTDNVAAYQLYLRSREFSAVGIATNRTAIELLRQAVALDPDFSDAWARLSWRYTWAARLGDLDAVEEAFATARRALDVDPESAFAHFALGSAYSVSEEIEENIASFERAIALDPDHLTLTGPEPTTMRGPAGRRSPWRRSLAPCACPGTCRMFAGMLRTCSICWVTSSGWRTGSTWPPPRIWKMSRLDMAACLAAGHAGALGGGTRAPARRP
jgi:TolB-like protein